jgi:hypothetical protein
MPQVHSIPIPQFDPDYFDFNTIRQKCNICVYGKRNSGKTTLMINILLYLHRHYPIGCAIAPTATVRLELAKRMPSSLIWTDFDLQKLGAAISKFGAIAMPNWKANVEDITNNKNILNWLLIMDDVGYKETMFKNVTFNEIYMNGRQIGLGTILNLQKLKSIPPGLRTNLDYIFLFRDQSETTQRSIHSEYFSFLPFHTFKEIYMKCTEGFNCLVLDIGEAQKAKDLSYSVKSLKSCIFVCSTKKIEELPDYSMFSPYVWKLDIAWKRLLKRRNTLSELERDTVTISKPPNTFSVGTVPAPIISHPHVSVPDSLTHIERDNERMGMHVDKSKQSFKRTQPIRTPETTRTLPTIAEESAQEPQQEPPVMEHVATKTVAIPATTKYSRYPISTFSSLRTISSSAPVCVGGQCPKIGVVRGSVNMRRAQESQPAFGRLR